jgi:hypothetical protein
MDLLDLAAAFSSLPLPKGNRVGIMTLGGGWGVVASDLCAWKGLELPELTPELLSRLDEILPPYWSRTNPVDIVGEQDWSIPMTIMEALLSWEGCDAVLNLGILGRRVFGQRLMGAAANHDPRLTRKEAEAIVEGIRQNENRFINHIVNLMERYQNPSTVSRCWLRDKTKPSSAYRINHLPGSSIPLRSEPLKPSPKWSPTPIIGGWGQTHDVVVTLFIPCYMLGVFRKSQHTMTPRETLSCP